MPLLAPRHTQATAGNIRCRVLLLRRSALPSHSLAGLPRPDCPAAPATPFLTRSTAEHCQEMVQQLAKALKARLDPPLGDKVRRFPRRRRRCCCWGCSAALCKRPGRVHQLC